VIPGFALYLVFGTELTQEAMLSGQRAMPKALESAGFSFTHGTVQAALAALR
jgi:hypothetical protein